MTYKIHIAFGFHINLYHSFRGDTHNDQGFGMDLRIIRGILRDLKALNAEGIQVKATWDIDNAFSLEQVIPDHAPELITDLKSRLEQHGDEILLMSYNNGMASGMTCDELKQCIQMAISNRHRSGVQDIFGQYTPLVRPQEMMVTPSNIEIYRELGIQGLCLYYSSAPFDAFRTMIPPLTEEEAFNPLNYEYKGMTLPVIPMISHFDLIDFGSLRAMINHLREKQKAGEINSDLLVFLNMDADATFWEGLALPGLLGSKRHVAGFYSMVKQIAKLDYVVFDTPFNYLKNHPPRKIIQFEQDLADGSFDGYANWSEKPFNHQVWTKIEQSRILTQKIKNLQCSLPSFSLETLDNLVEHAFELRLRLLSSTHFGLASPKLHKDREKAIDSLVTDFMDSLWRAWMMLNRSWEIVNKHQSAVPETLKNRSPELKASFPILFLKEQNVNGCLHVVLRFNESIVRYLSDLKLMNDAGETLKASFLEVGRHPDKSLEEVALYAANIPGKPNRLWVGVEEDAELNYHGDLLVDQLRLSGNGINIESRAFNVYRVMLKDQEIGDSNFLQSFIRYQSDRKNENYAFTVQSKALICPEEGGAAGYRFRGLINLPGQLQAGTFRLDLFLIDGMSAILTRMDLRYPKTTERMMAWNEFDTVGRPYDAGWIEVATLQIQLILSDQARIHKFNYQKDSGSYALNSFYAADRLNLTLDAFNHHVTAGKVGVGDENYGFLLAIDRWRLSGLAFCPMRQIPAVHGHTLKLNPFGTYYGRQKQHSSFGTELAQKLISAVSPNHKSMAPAYNAAMSCFSLALIPFSGASPSPKHHYFAEALNSSANVYIPINAFAEEKFINFKETLFSSNTKQEEEISETRLFNSLLKEIPLNLKWKVAILLIKAWGGR